MITSKSYTKRIGIVLSSTPGYSETFFRNKIKGLQEEGFEVLLFVDYKSDETDLSCQIKIANNFNHGKLNAIWTGMKVLFKTFFVHPKRSYTLFQLDKSDGISLKQRLRHVILNQYLLEQHLDWLHFGYGMLAVGRENVAKAINAKMAVSFRGFDLYLSPIKHKDCYRLLFKKQVQYHVLSHKMKEILVENFIPENHIYVITPAIDNTFFQNTKHEIEHEKLQIVCVSRLHWVKGLNYTLEALHILKCQGIDFRFIIIGSGPERERLMFLAYQLGILDDVDFIGKVNHNDVLAYLNMADIYVQYSIQEGFGNAVLEAQAMGIFCVVSDADGLQENILHNQTGLVVPKRQPALLAEEIMKVVSMDRQLKNQIKDTAKKRVEQDYNLERQKKLFSLFYNEQPK